MVPKVWAAVVIAGAAVAAGLPVNAADREEVNIGLIAPLTLGNARMGEDIRRTVEIAVDEANASPDAVYRFKLIVEDGKCGVGSAAATAASKLISVDKVKALVISCSGEIMTAAPMIEQHGVPTMVVYATHPKVKQLGPYIYRVFADSEKDLPIVTRRMISEGRQRVAILSEEIPFAVGVRDVLHRELGSRVVSSMDYHEGETDFRTVLVKTLAAKPDSIFLNAGSVETLGALVRQLKSLKAEVPLYSFGYAAADTFLQTYASDAEGMEFIGPPDVESAEMAALLDTFRKRSGREPNVPFVVATAYDGATALLSAIAKSGATTSSVLSNLEKYSATGVLGPIGFDANGDANGVHYVLREIREGKMAAVR